MAAMEAYQQASAINGELYSLHVAGIQKDFKIIYITVYHLIPHFTS